MAVNKAFFLFFEFFLQHQSQQGYTDTEEEVGSPIKLEEKAKAARGLLQSNKKG